jgi:hypothetical protein
MKTLLLSLVLLTQANVLGAQELPFFSVSLDEFRSAPCRSQEAPSAEQMASLFQQKAGQLPAAYRELTQYLDAESRLRVQQRCGDVLCSVEQIWGEELGRKLLYLQLQHGANASEYSVRAGAAKRYSLPQIDHILMTLADLPPNLRSGVNGKLLLAVGQRNGAAAYTVGRKIEFYDHWANIAARPEGVMARRTILHELGHRFDGPRSVVHPGWRRARGCAVSQYGQSNTMEDFAETFVAYRYAGAALKAKCPAKYEFMQRNVFGGTEYLNSVSCE